jgi:hypothetical protein
VRVYETEPGLLEEVEVGQPDLSRAAEPAGLSMLERYEYYTGSPAPQALREASERVAQMRSARGPVDPSARVAVSEQGAPVSLGVVDKELHQTPADRTWFVNNFCQATDRFWGNLRGETLFAGTTWWSNRTEYFRTGVYMLKGGVASVRMSCNGDGQVAVLEAVGWYLSRRCDSAINRAVESRVAADPSVEYFHCINFHF